MCTVRVPLDTPPRAHAGHGQAGTTIPWLEVGARGPAGAAHLPLLPGEGISRSAWSPQMDRMYWELSMPNRPRRCLRRGC